MQGIGQLTAVVETIYGVKPDVKYESLSSFLIRLDRARVDGLIERRLVVEKHRQKIHLAIPEAHWTTPEMKKMLSVTPEEGNILFAFARVLQPSRIVELGTGSGISTAYLAAGWRDATVITVDNWQEGNCKSVATELWRRLELKVELFESNVQDLPSKDLTAPLLFVDGLVKYHLGDLADHLPRGAIIIEHDTVMRPGFMNHQRMIPSPSQLSIHGDDERKLEQLHDLALIFCDY